MWRVKLSSSFPFSGMRVRFAGETDIGKDHTENEDAIFLPSAIPLGVVADGMGGAAAGEVASKMAVEIVSDYFDSTSAGWNPIWPMQLDPLNFNMFRMESSIVYANSKIHSHSKKDSSCKNMGTTVVAIYFENNYAIISHVGDSRVYRIRNGDMELLLEDHSYVNDIARLRGITPEEAANSGIKINVVTRVIGPNAQVTPDSAIIYPQLDDIFILCSDGLNDMISDDRIKELSLSSKDLDEVCEKLIEAANDAGGEDNITALVCRIEPDE
jgi:PPM family protein phosphatase